MIASIEPCTSPLMTSGNSFSPLVCSCDIICSSEPRWPACLATAFSRALRWRYSVISRARASLLTTAKRSPACGVPCRPSTSTGIAGGASLICSPRSLTSARTRPHSLPATRMSPGMQRAGLHQHRGDRAAALVELGFDDDALGGAVGIGLEVENFGLQQDRFEQLVEIGALGRRHLDVQHLAAQRFDEDLVLQQLRAHLLRVGLTACRSC